ncbi:MAG: alpha-amylase family glycosyl hydrolase [Prevotella sp.]|jgi:alpha-amylase
MKKEYRTLLAALAFVPFTAFAQGWQDNYQGVMLQGFSWDSYVDTQWSNLESQADELSTYFSLIWVPQSGNCNSSWNVMGYTPVYYFDQNSSFGTEAQLRSMISTFKAKGTGIIADVVINHRNVLGQNDSWVDYPAETYNGTTYQMTSTDITSDDDGGATKTWADANGYTLGNADEGEDWSGCRDLDHQSSNVQTIVKAYENYLLNDLGYTGFRYDMVKGFDASHIKDYNTACNVPFSVGENWSSNAVIKSWIDGTDKTSAAFDFQFRYAVRDAINNGDWSLLGSKAYLVNSNFENGDYRRYAVTFVENHDMQDRGTTSGYTPDPIKKDTLAANAFLLAMPGTPCVFLPHWKAYKEEIKTMINARKAAGISNTSSFTPMRSSATLYAVNVTGNTANLIAAVGSGVSSYTPSSQFVQVASGYHYAYYLNKSAETAWVSKPSGTYTDAFDVTLQAISNDASAKLVYTTDGSDPTANSTQVADGTKLTISSSMTLKVGLLSSGSVKGIITRDYVIKPFEAHTATVYLKDPSWDAVYFYAWDNTSSNTQLLGSWPGTKITATKSINGSNWYYHSFDINEADYTFNIIFDQGSGKDQTVDIGPISEDKYYEIATKNSNGKYTVNDLTSTITGISDVTYTKPTSTTGWYTLQGVRIDEPTQRGIYIHNGHKVIVK